MSDNRHKSVPSTQLTGTMGRRVRGGFVAVLIPLMVMSLVIFNANNLMKIGHNIYIYFHGDSYSQTRNHLVHSRDDAYLSDGTKKLLNTGADLRNEYHREEKVANASNVPILDNLGHLSGIINGVRYKDNRVLYKWYRATQDPSFKCVIRILKYRRRKGEEALMGGQDKWQVYGCEGLPCSVETRYSTDMREFRDSDAAVMMPGPFYSYDWKRLLKIRPPGQQWVLYTKESPVHEPQFAPPRDVFQGNPYNLSMTFRSGSDIDLSYGHYYFNQTSHKKIHLKKSKLMMWMASRCEPLGWERTKFVHALQKYLPVDIYGKCGTLDCPKHDWDACLKMIQKYKFYLSLENSECNEYITEKFWSNGFAVGLVPIVYGAPRDDYAKVAPPNSFIHLNDFSTMQEFVDYINLLDKNNTLYEKYFEWRKHGKTTMGPGFRSALSPTSLCNLVKKMVEVSLYPENSWRTRTPDFEKWWRPQIWCHHQTELLGVKI